MINEKENYMTPKLIMNKFEFVSARSMYYFIPGHYNYCMIFS